MKWEWRKENWYQITESTTDNVQQKLMVIADRHLQKSGYQHNICQINTWRPNHRRPHDGDPSCKTSSQQALLLPNKSNVIPCQPTKCQHHVPPCNFTFCTNSNPPCHGLILETKQNKMILRTLLHITLTTNPPNTKPRSLIAKAFSLHICNSTLRSTQQHQPHNPHSQSLYSSSDSINDKIFSYNT